MEHLSWSPDFSCSDFCQKYMFNDNLNVKVFPLDLRKGEQPFAASEDGSDTNSNERKARQSSGTVSYGALLLH